MTARGVHIEQGSQVHESVLMDGVRLCRDVFVCNAIVDKRNTIPSGFQIGVDLQEDKRLFSVSEGGIVVVQKEMPLFRA